MTRNRFFALVLITVLAFTAGCLGSAKKPERPPAADGNGSTPAQTDPVLDQAAGVYRLAPVNAPSGGGTAWVEVAKTYDEGLTPLSVTFHASRDGVELSTESQYLAAEDAASITWIDATTVMLGGRWLADFNGPGKLITLPDYAWSHQVNPDRTKIAFWGRINPGNPDDSSMGPQIYDLATGKIQVIKTFTSEDWGFEGEIGVLPLVAWLDGNTLLFDAPRPMKTSVFKYDLATGRIDVWRDDGWHVLASGDGNYVAVAHTNAAGEYSTFIIDMKSGVETELASDKYGYPTWVVWRGNTLVAYNSGAVGVGTMAGGRPVFADSYTSKALIDVRPSDTGASFVEVEAKDGVITALKSVTLSAKPR